MPEKNYTDQYFPNTKFICIDGLDCSGKESVSKILKNLLIEYYNRFRATGEYKYNIYRISFPDYGVNNTPSSVKLLLDSYYPNLFTFKQKDRDRDAFIKTDIFLYNIYDKLVYFDKELCRSYFNNPKTKNIVILDRYWQSNLWYQGMPYWLNTGSTDDFEKYVINKVNDLNLPKVDVFFYLKSPMDIITKFLLEKENKDVNELDATYLTNVKKYLDENFDRFTKYNRLQSGDTTIIKNTNSKGELLSLDYIAYSMFEYLIYNSRLSCNFNVTEEEEY